MRIKSIRAPGSGGNIAVYPWRDLKIGGMFEATHVSQSTIASGATRVGQRLGRRFSCTKRPGRKGVFVVRRIA